VSGHPVTRPIRVLQIVTSLVVGGAERLVVAAASGLPSSEYDIRICCFSERGPLATEAAERGIQVWCLDAFPSLRRPAALWRLYRIIRAFAPDIVHTHLQAPNLYGRLVAIVSRVPVVVASEHNVYGTKARRYVWVERVLATRTTALIAVTEQVRRFLSQQLGIDPSRILTIENGIAPASPSPARVAEWRRRLALPSERPVLATVASLTPKKGHTFLIDAFAQLRARDFAGELLLAGDGPERAALEAKAAALGVADRIHFLGVVRHIADVLALCDVFVLPSLVEGLPLALLEAMAAGKPVVATAVGGVPDVVSTGTNGVLVEPGSAGALAAALDDICRRADLRRMYGERARRTVLERFTEDRYLTALSGLYKSSIARLDRAGA
jgi:glycosyltransferase involved in cell wall biosynthesis